MTINYRTTSLKERKRGQYLELEERGAIQIINYWFLIFIAGSVTFSIYTMVCGECTIYKYYDKLIITRK